MNLFCKIKQNFIEYSRLFCFCERGKEQDYPSADPSDNEFGPV